VNRTIVNRVVWACGAAVALVLLPVAVGADAVLRVGYVDSARIFQQYTAAQEAQQRFDRQVQGWRDEASEKEKLVNQLRGELRDQSAILSSLKRQEKEQAVQKAVSDYEQFVQQIWGPQGRAQQENERATAEVVAQIRSAVEKVAGTKNLNLVLDSASGFILYADKELDLTSDVLTELTARVQGTTRH
jgi:outer membrane protein